MPLSKQFQQRIEAVFGRPVKCSADCEALAECIFQVTKKTIGVTSLKRMFGLATDTTENRRGSTMDQIAQYLGYKDKKEMDRMLGEDSDISMFAVVDELDIENLEPGTLIQISYDPRRLIVMDYMGDNWFIVNEAQNSKLQKGDKLHIHQLAKGLELLASEVIRDGQKLGQYEAAKDGGLTLIEII